MISLPLAFSVSISTLKLSANLPHLILAKRDDPGTIMANDFQWGEYG
jgi:hypothetical protein